MCPLGGRKVQAEGVSVKNACPHVTAGTFKGRVCPGVLANGRWGWEQPLSAAPASSRGVNSAMPTASYQCEAAEPGPGRDVHPG